MSLNISVLQEIQRLQKDEENGVLVLSRPGERLTITYRDGIVQSASSSQETHRLGTYFVREGLLKEKDVLKVAAEAKKRKIMFGEVAVENRYLDPAELADLVRRQAMDLLTYAFEEGFKVETYIKGIRSFYASAGISVEHILLEMSRRNPAALDADSKTVFALKQGENLAGVPWFPKELAILGELDGTANIEILTQSTGIDEPTVRKILAVFSRLGIIEQVGDDPTPGSSPECEPTSPIKKSEFAFERLVPFVSNPVFSEELEVIKNPSSFISEQFKTLKVRIRQDHQNSPRVLTISSPEQQDGKSLVSANFALALAMEKGRRTVIVDCDLRSPSLDKYLGVIPEPGLIQHLSNGRFLPHCCMRRIGNLYFMTSGGISESPTEMLSVRKMKELIESLRRDFDTVILDAPPYSPVADAQIISGLSDGVIMVIRSGKTSKSNIEHAFKVIDKKKLLGVVFNDVVPTLLNSYYHRYHYAYGGYGKAGDSGKRRLRSTPKGYLDS